MMNNSDYRQSIYTVGVRNQTVQPTYKKMSKGYFLSPSLFLEIAG